MGQDITIHLPPVSEDAISDGLRDLTRIIIEASGQEPGGGLLGGEYGYGAKWNTDTFQMHPFCWCDLPTCPWCVGCSCPDTASGYTVDGKPATLDEWVDVHKRATDHLHFGSAAYKAASEAANERRGEWHTPECPFCLTGGVAALQGGGPGICAPHFWHKPSGLKAQWNMTGERIPTATPTNG